MSLENSGMSVDGDQKLLRPKKLKLHVTKDGHFPLKKCQNININVMELMLV